MSADTAAGSATTTNDYKTEEEAKVMTAAPAPTTPLLDGTNATDNTPNVATNTVTAGDNKNVLRVVRLEQNRKAASESRKRKRILLDELQRSVIFFTRANDTLKLQNQNLQTLLEQAQSQINNVNDKQKEDVGNKEPAATATELSSEDNNDEKKKMPLPIVLPPPLPVLPQMSNFLNTVETGATIQAMTNFQQAASAAMKAALLHVQQQYENKSGDTDDHGNNNNNSTMHQQHQLLFEIATLSVPTTSTSKAPSEAAAAAVSDPVTEI